MPLTRPSTPPTLSISPQITALAFSSCFSMSVFGSRDDGLPKKIDVLPPCPTSLGRLVIPSSMKLAQPVSVELLLTSFLMSTMCWRFPRNSLTVTTVPLSLFAVEYACILCLACAAKIALPCASIAAIYLGSWNRGMIPLLSKKSVIPGPPGKLVATYTSPLLPVPPPELGNVLSAYEFINPCSIAFAGVAIPVAAATLAVVILSPMRIIWLLPLELGNQSLFGASSSTAP